MIISYISIFYCESQIQSY